MSGEIKTSVAINIPRGLVSIAEQLLAKHVKPRFGEEVANGIGDIVKAAIRENPSIPQQDISAVEIARKVGLLPKLKPVIVEKRRAGAR